MGLNMSLSETNSSSECTNNNIVYAISTFHNKNNSMDNIIFVSEEKNKTCKMLNFLNNNLKDPTILNSMLTMHEDEEYYVHEFKEILYVSDNPDEILDKLLGVEPNFIMIEFNKNELELHYKHLRSIFPSRIKLIYDFICIEGMLNNSFYKRMASRINDVHYKNNKELLGKFKKIRRIFNDEFII